MQDVEGPVRWALDEPLGLQLLVQITIINFKTWNPIIMRSIFTAKNLQSSKIYLGAMYNETMI